MDSRETANDGPSMASPALMVSNVMALCSRRTNGLAAAGADHLAVLVEEHIVVHHEQPLAADELVERAGLQRDGVAGPRRDVVTPGLTGIDGAGRAHPVVGRRAG